MDYEELISKYRDGKLTTQELFELRRILPNLSDAELDDVLLRSLVDHTPTGDARFLAKVSQIKEKLDHELFSPPTTQRLSLSKRLLQYAAIIAIPLLIACTTYFYKKASLVNDASMVIRTASGERVSIVLPDGSSVTLNANSELSYSPAFFNKRSRSIEFHGEALFDVEKNPNIPFEILSDKLKLRVIGTKFNFMAYAQQPQIEVKLLEGEVLLTSLHAHREEIHLFPNQMASFDKSSGHITVQKEKIQIKIPWVNRQMIFESAPIETVVETVERTYGIQIHMDNQLSESIHFTGLLPTDNLDEVIFTLQKCLDCQFSRADKNVYFTQK